MIDKDLRRCARCGEYQPLHESHFQAGPDGDYAHHCWDCGPGPERYARAPDLVVLVNPGEPREFVLDLEPLP